MVNTFECYLVPDDKFNWVSDRTTGLPVVKNRRLLKDSGENSLPDMKPAKFVFSLIFAGKVPE